MDKNVFIQSAITSCGPTMCQALCLALGNNRHPPSPGLPAACPWEVTPSLCVSGFASEKFGSNSTTLQGCWINEINLQQKLRAEPGTELGLNMSLLLLFLPLLAMPVGAVGSCWGADGVWEGEVDGE